RGVAPPGSTIRTRLRAVLRRDHGRVGVLAGAAGPDEAVLRALVAFDLGVLKGLPVRLLLAETADEFPHDVFDRDTDQFRRPRMPCNAHDGLLWKRGIVATSLCLGRRCRQRCGSDRRVANSAMVF